MTDRTLVLSAGNLLARGYLAIPADRENNGLFAVTRAFRRVLSMKVPQRAVAVLGPTPDVVAPQRKKLPDILAAHGVRVVEAEDEGGTVAAYVKTALDDGHDVVVLASDKRYAQLVSDVVWWYDAYKDARYTPDMIVKRFQVGPDKVSQWLALVGDDDTLGGVKGIGKKSATTILETYGTVEKALEHTADLDTRTKNALEAAREVIPTELDRAKLAPTAALPAPLDDLEYEAPATDKLNELYADLGFLELLATEEADVPVEICDTAAKTEAAIAKLTGEVAIHVVYEDPSPARGAPVGLAAATESDERFYFTGDGFTALEPWLEDGTKKKLSHDFATAIVSLAHAGVTLAGMAGDSACASHLTEPSNLAPHDLSIVARHVLRRALPSDEEVRGVGRRRKSWSKVKPEATAAYASAYASAAGAAWRKLSPSLDANLLAEYDAITETVARMELRGIGVSADELERAGKDFAKTQVELETKIHELAGKQFNLASPKQLGSVLFEDLGLTVVKRTKTGWSTATDALERIEGEHAIVPLVIRYRALKRLQSTWIRSLADCIDTDDRVHSTFNAARSFTGRLVNSNPDLGRVPGRTEEMQRIRRAFVAAEGNVLLSLDFNQLGLHVLAHLTKDPALVEPLRDRADMHTLTASAVLEVPAAEITRDQRQLGKVVNFATFAGQGASALAMQLGVTAKEAKAYIARFDERYAVVRAFQDEQLRLAKEEGHITTILGRRWPIGALESLDIHDRSYAERLARRATHEGSVADVSRKGLLDADLALRAANMVAAPLLQIHDEVLFEVPASELDEAARIASEAMRNCYALEVPLSVGAKAGPNWADLSPLAP